MYFIRVGKEAYLLHPISNKEKLQSSFKKMYHLTSESRDDLYFLTLWSAVCLCDMI